MQSYPNRLPQQLKQDLASFYMVFGDEPQQKLDCIESIRQSARQQGFDERQTYTADAQFSWSTLTEASQSMSLFASRQLIELDIPTGKPGAEGAKALTACASFNDPDTLYILHGGKIGKDVQNTKWFKALDKLGVYIPCYPLEGQNLHNWVKQCFDMEGLTAERDALVMLAEYCEGNLLAAKQEIQKLALLFPNDTITTDKIESSVVEQSRFNVFQLVDVMLAGDPQKTVKMLYRLESEGIEPNILLWALVREWQLLSQLHFARQQGQTINWNQHRIWKNRQGMYLSALNRLNQGHLQQIEHKLMLMDSKLKQSVVARPYVELCHLCLLFMPMPLEKLALD